MTELDIKNKNKVLIDYLRTLTNDFVVRAEYSTFKDNENVIVVQEESGSKVVFFEANPIYNYYNVDIFGTNIQVSKNLSVDIGNLIGNNIYFNWTTTNDKNEVETQKWQILIKQFSNPRTLEWSDIRRVSYTMTLQCIINRIS
jgi:hypothetical protein